MRGATVAEGAGVRALFAEAMAPRLYREILAPVVALNVVMSKAHRSPRGAHASRLVPRPGRAARQGRLPRNSHRPWPHRPSDGRVQCDGGPPHVVRSRRVSPPTPNARCAAPPRGRVARGAAGTLARPLVYGTPPRRPQRRSVYGSGGDAKLRLRRSGGARTGPDPGRTGPGALAWYTQTGAVVRSRGTPSALSACGPTQRRSRSSHRLRARWVLTWSSRKRERARKVPRPRPPVLPSNGRSGAVAARRHSLRRDRRPPPAVARELGDPRAVGRAHGRPRDGPGGDDRPPRRPQPALPRVLARRHRSGLARLHRGAHVLLQGRAARRAAARHRRPDVRMARRDRTRGARRTGGSSSRSPTPTGSSPWTRSGRACRTCSPRSSATAPR